MACVVIQGQTPTSQRGFHGLVRPTRIFDNFLSKSAGNVTISTFDRPRFPGMPRRPAASTSTNTTILFFWSGDESKQVASALCKWLRKLFPTGIEFKIFEQTVKAGVDWRLALLRMLRSADLAVPCVTQESLRSPWMVFEAGVVTGTSKGRSLKPVIPFLAADIDPRIWKDSPLSSFQGVPANMDGALKLVQSVCEVSKSNLQEHQIQLMVEGHWKELESDLKAIFNVTLSERLLTPGELNQVIRSLRDAVESWSTTVPVLIKALTEAKKLQLAGVSSNASEDEEKNSLPKGMSEDGK